MSIDKYFDRIGRIDQLIRLRATGSPTELAEKMGLSERALYICLDEMKALGAPIAYDNLSKTYYYTEEGRFDMSFHRR